MTPRTALLATALLAAACGARGPDERGVPVPGGRFLMGSDEGEAWERPVHEVAVHPIRMGRTPVTVAEFARFVAATGYRTASERLGWSGVFDRPKSRWARTAGADWRHPDGPAATSAAPDEPVTQVSWDDASAYCRWAGARLPTEAEFEHAARGGLRHARYAWGDELMPGGRPPANWWQGAFPFDDTGADGFAGRAPAGSFPPNGYGLCDMAGNVWEWCADWFDDAAYAVSSHDDPAGPPRGTERVIRGGSWLCNEATCQGYRVAARGRVAPDSATNHLGFRCVFPE